ncbi:phytoene desaturase family protein [Nocardia spumae]|uniref:phytoene desaturase family protein n=1 Tax=Nocardia spumae TaxID=2887190 RepID=UPI001D157316|nr:NAD(P)/FAD-dependent oxidoreductase [Nocardia spumae]
MRDSHDVVIVGGGHNGLVAAAYLARAGVSVLLLEQRDRTGGAAVSERLFPGIDARLSRYSYLVSLLPDRIVHDLGLSFRTLGRRISSYTPVGDTGLLVDTADPDRTRESFRAVTGSDADYAAWQQFYGLTARAAERIFPTLLEPLPTRPELQRALDDSEAWELLFDRPLGETIEARFGSDTVRGVVLTDALIGTFTHAHDPSLRQNRCFLYHVIGGGSGDWNVPVGGMGALTDALAAAARRAGAHLRTGATVTGIETDGGTAEVRFDTADGAEVVAARHVLVNAAPHTLARLLGESNGPAPEGSQLKVNMVLRRLPRLRADIDPADAFSGTFHIAEGYDQLERAYGEAANGLVPSAPPSEIYCHTLTDPSILGPEAAAQGMHTLTLFGLHTPASLFDSDHSRIRTRLLNATLSELNAVLAEPIQDCLAVDANGDLCLEAKTPVELDSDLGLPRGHIFHRDLTFPIRTDADPAPAARWGVRTGHDNIFLCGAGSVRGGGVSGIGGHNAAMAVLESRRLS